MELVIRSQDKNKLIKFDRIRLEDDNRYNPNSYNDITTKPIYNGTRVLVNDIYFGTYKTKERALKVLDEIQNALVGKIIVEPKYIVKQKDKEALKEMVEEKTIIKSPAVDIKTLNQNCVVYELPRE